MRDLKDLYLFCENIPSQIIAGCNELFGYTPKLEPIFDKRTEKKYQVNIISDKERFLHIYHFKSDGKTTI